MITAFWWDVDSAVKTAIKQRIPSEVRGIKFCYKSGMLFIRLPSGRMLSYVKPRIEENRFENIVQAISRDLLCYAMRNLSDHQICGHVHDELIIECLEGTDVSSITSVMGMSPEWMPEILVRGDGYETKFYKKD